MTGEKIRCYSCGAQNAHPGYSELKSQLAEYKEGIREVMRDHAETLGWADAAARILTDIRERYFSTCAMDEAAKDIDALMVARERLGHIKPVRGGGEDEILQRLPTLQLLQGNRGAV